MQPTLIARGIELLPDELLAEILEQVEQVTPEETWPVSVIVSAIS